jgi:hypothetical protein
MDGDDGGDGGAGEYDDDDQDEEDRRYGTVLRIRLLPWYLSYW